MDEKPVKVINGDGLILGRVVSYIAKNAMKGERFHVKNAEMMVISGSRNEIVAKYVKRRNLRNKANPEHSPKWPKRPDYLVKRVLKGMLPFAKASGKSAYRNVMIYMGDEGPKVEGEHVEFGDSFKKDKLIKYITVLELCRALSYRH